VPPIAEAVAREKAMNERLEPGGTEARRREENQ